MLRLDPVADREEHAELDGAGRRRAAGALEELLDPRGRRRGALALRSRNLGVDRWGVWARGAGESVLDALDGDARCLVVDLGSLDTREEQALVAERGARRAVGAARASASRC